MEEAAQILRVGRNQAYELARVWRATGGERGVPVVEFGRLLRVPKAALLRLAGLAEPLGTARGPEAAACGLRLDSRALALGYRHGSDTLARAAGPGEPGGRFSRGTVVAASYRDIARRLGISKDTVGRRVQVLRRSGVVVDRARALRPFRASVPTCCTSNWPA